MPTGLVVKNGSNALSRTSGVMPMPESLTEPRGRSRPAPASSMSRVVPGRRAMRGQAPGWRSGSPARRPACMAWPAFSARFSNRRVELSGVGLGRARDRARGRAPGLIRLADPMRGNSSDNPRTRPLTSMVEGSQRLAPGERQKLTWSAVSPPRSIASSERAMYTRQLRRSPPDSRRMQDLEVGLHDHQQVVEVVRDAAGQLADGAASSATAAAWLRRARARAISRSQRVEGRFLLDGSVRPGAGSPPPATNGDGISSSRGTSGQSRMAVSTDIERGR